MAEAKFEWLYCCALHDPRLSAASTKDFRIEDLKESKGRVVKEYRGCQDVYAGQPLLRGMHYEMDHVVELHQVRDAYNSVTKNGTGFRARMDKLLLSLKDAVNVTENLAFTSPDTNKSKFKAVKSFLKDYRRGDGRQLEEGLFPYLKDEFEVSHTWSRSVSKNIQSVLLTSSDKVIEELQEEDPLQLQVVETLQKDFTAMKLH